MVFKKSQNLTCLISHYAVMNNECFMYKVILSFCFTPHLPLQGPETGFYMKATSMTCLIFNCDILHNLVHQLFWIGKDFEPLLHLTKLSFGCVRVRVKG